MRTNFWWILLPAMAAGQVTVEVSGVTATQAVVVVRGATSPCIFELREGRCCPLHPDVARTADTSRPDTIVWQDGTRIVTLGHPRADLALAADTEYEATVSGCGSGSFRFRTGMPPLGATMAMPLPVNAKNWDNADFPQIDFSPAGRDKWYVDPTTGIKVKLVNRPEDFSKKRQTDDAFPAWAGGTAWMNPASAANGSTSSYATTSNTNPLFLYTYAVSPYQSYHSLENLGILVYGSCESGSVEDCAIDVGITMNPSEGFSGSPIRIVLPPGRVVKVPGGSSHEAANGAFPTAYPQPLFAGWGDIRVWRDQYVLPGAATLTSALNGVLTIDSPDANTHFQKSLTTGHHIWVQDSGCSANGAPDVCTVASPGNAGSLTLTETGVNGTRKQFRAFPWGIMVRKVTAFGTINVGFKHRWAGTVNVATAPGAVSCGNVEVSDADGVKGHPCVVGGMIYFISNDGEVVRPVLGLGSPPSFGAQFIGQSPAFSPTDGNVLYVTDFRGSNLYKLTYRGDWKSSAWDTDARRYRINIGGDYPYFDEDVTWELAITPSLGEQMASLYPRFASDPYSAWTSGLYFGGISGDLAVFYKTLSGQDGGPCHVAVVNVKTGTLIDAFSTLEDGGAGAWGNCHSIQASSIPNTISLTLNILNLNDRNRISGGPYRMPVEAVMVNGSWVAEKGLPWPIDDSYDNQCPADLPEEYTSFGATGNQCITLLTSGHPCNIAPGNLETSNPSLHPVCNWNSDYRVGPPLRPGHSFVDMVSGGAAPGDSEQFRVVAVEEIPDSGKLKVIAQRNARRDYCCIGYPLCVSSPGQQTHRAGFTGLMIPGSKASCSSCLLAITYPDGTLASKTTVELSRSYQGHSAAGRGPRGTLRYLAPQSALTVPDFSWLGIQPPIVPMRVSNPTFNGVSATIGGALQQYLNHSQGAASDEKTVYSFDANAVNGPFGIFGGNHFSNAVQGSRVLTHVSGDIWTTTAIGRVDYKNRPLIGWSGQKVLGDVSGRSSNIAAAPAYSFCYAYTAGECYPDSLKGGIYVKAPNVYKHPGNGAASLCQTAMTFAEVPCIISAEPATGFVRQFRTDRPDPTGSDQRLITTALRPYGTHYPYWAAVAHPAGDTVLVLSGGWLQGLRESVLLAKLPPYPDVPERRNSYGGLTVRIDPRDGMTHARVRFGYNTSFHCTERSEACLTDDDVTPFAFESESRSGTACASGCSMTVPVIAGRVVYYRVELYDGSRWQNDQTMTAVAE
jgi:hypothetical protein